MRKRLCSSGAHLSMLGLVASAAEASTVFDGNRMVVSIAKAPGTAPNCKPRAVNCTQINNTHLGELCGDADGCTVELGVTGIHDGAGPIVAPYLGPPCRFFVRDRNDGTADWTVSPHCYQNYTTTKGNYRPYVSDGAGIDGSSAERATGGRVLNFLNACFLAEAPPNTSVTTGDFLPDTERSFYLVAGDATWVGSHALPESACKAGKFCWNGRSKTCKLVIRD